MSILSRLFNYGKYVPPGSIPPQAAPYAFNFYTQLDVPVDLRLTPQQQLSTRTVYACIRIIARSVARAPWKIYTKNTTGSRIELSNDPISYLLNVRPNPSVPAVSFREAMIVQAIVHGNSYAEIVTDGAGRIRELNVIPSEWITPKLALGNEMLSTSPARKANPRELVYQIVGGSENVGILLAPEQVLHIRGLSTVDGIVGDSLVSRAAKSIANAFAIEQFSLQYYANGSLIGAVVKLPPGQAPTPDKKNEFDQEWVKRKTGVKNSFRTLFLGAGSDFQIINHDAQKAQVIPARNYSVEDIASYFGVPLYMLGVSATGIQGNGKNLNEHGLVFVRDALRPWAVSFQQEADYKLFPDRAPYRNTEMDLSEFTRGDELDRAKAGQIWIQSGVKTINEIREAEGMNHIQGDQAEFGNMHFISSGVVQPQDESDPVIDSGIEQSAASTDDANGGEEEGA